MSGTRGFERPRAQRRPVFVMPAKAGIHVETLDSRFRGNAPMTVAPGRL